MVVTSLRNRAMPLVRYRIGDEACWAAEPCPCGRHWPLLGKVAGRVTDSFVTASGALVHGAFFTRLFYDRPWVRRFQVVQDEVTSITVRLAPIDAVEVAQREHGPDTDALAHEIQAAMGARSNRVTVRPWALTARSASNGSGRSPN